MITVYSHPAAQITAGNFLPDVVLGGGLAFYSVPLPPETPVEVESEPDPAF